MKNTMLWSVAAILIVIVAAAYTGFVVGKNSVYPAPYTPENITAVEPEHGLPQGARSGAPKYRLGEQDGRLAVYTVGKEIPDLVFDVYIKYLPPVDQAALRAGIEVYDYNELTKLIEDYIS